MNFADPQAEVPPIPPAPAGPGGLSPTARCPPVPQPGPGMLGAKLFPWPGLRAGRDVEAPRSPHNGNDAPGTPGGGLALCHAPGHTGEHTPGSDGLHPTGCFLGVPRARAGRDPRRCHSPAQRWAPGTCRSAFLLLWQVRASLALRDLPFGHRGPAKLFEIKSII